MNRKEFIIVLVITFLVFMVWVIAEIIHAKPSIPIDPKIQALLTPVDPNLDKATLDKVGQIKQLQIKASPDVPASLPSIDSLESALEEIPQESTDEGQLDEGL